MVAIPARCNYSMQLCKLVLAVVLLSSCTGNPDHNIPEGEQGIALEAALPDTTETLHLTGPQLAQAYCKACHAFPDPSLLDKATWGKGVLPQMALRLGINDAATSLYMNKPPEEVIELMQARIFPEKPLITARDWDKIVSYYLQNAPEQLTLPATPMVKPDLDNFSVVVPGLNKGKYALTTLVKYDPGAHALWIGDLRNWLFRLDSKLQVTDSIQLPSAPVDLLKAENAYKVLSIGSMNPSDAKAGKLLQFTVPVKAAAPELLMEGLRRPVSMAAADLDRDGLQDLIVCHYGNNMGALVWYRNTGQGKYEPVILKSLPGALKADIVDFNGDGRLDVVAMFAQATESIKVFYNRGRGKFEEETLVQFPPVYGLSYFELADFNKDGFPDIVLATGDNADYSPVLKPYHGIHILLNNGKNKFSERYFYPMPGASKVLARDFDQDGDLDIAAISFFPDFTGAPEKGFVYLQQEEDYTFKASTFSQSQTGHWLTMEAGDYDQDKDLDIILGSFIYTPAPPAVQDKWVKEGPGVIVLQNNSNRKRSMAALKK